MLRKRLEEKLEGKVSPAVIQVIYLDEIAGLLFEQLERMEEAENEGVLDTISVTINVPLFEMPVKDWYSASFFNDGPNPVFVDVNNDGNVRGFGTPLNLGENLVVNYEKPRIKRIFAGVQAGLVAGIRIFGTR